MIVKLGDIVQILGSTDDTLEYWYGEIVGRTGDQFELYYITRTAIPQTWVFEEHYNVAEKESINRIARTKHGDYAKAWAMFGFIYEKGPPISLVEDPSFSENTTSDSESLDSCDSWSSSDEESKISELIDDSEISSTVAIEEQSTA